MRTAGLLITWALCSMITVNAQTGQDDNTYDPPAWAMIDDSLGHELDLTNDQMKLVQEADDRYRESMRKGDGKAMEMRDRDLKAALLPSQYKEWQGIVEKRKAMMKPPVQ